MIACAYAANAQSTQMYIRNRTNCNVYFATPQASSTCPLGVSGSNPGVVGPNSMVPYNSGTPDQYFSLKVYAVNPFMGSCGTPTAVVVGAPCTTLPSSDVLDIYNPGCILCRPSVNVVYDFSNAPTDVTVTIF